MNLGRCPVCHSRISLEAMVQDEAGRELLALLARTEAAVAMPLVAYLGLFRPETRDLANDRALRLAQETLALGQGQSLATALAHTVEALRAKGGGVLKNHNYLKRVLEGQPAQSMAIQTTASAVLRPIGARPKPLSATEEAVLSIRSLRFDDRHPNPHPPATGHGE